MIERYSPTVHDAYYKDPYWFHKHSISEDDIYDKDGYDAYGYDERGVDRAGNREYDYYGEVGYMLHDRVAGEWTLEAIVSAK